MEKINSAIIHDLTSSNRDKMEYAFMKIYNKYAYLVYYLSLEIVRSKLLAEEVTNETFLKLYENRNKLKVEKNVKYFLVKVCKNLSINKSLEEKKYASLDKEIFEAKKKDYFFDYIEKFKDFLSKEEVDLIVLHLLYDFTFKEIAKDKSTTVDVISSKYRRAILKVKQHYKGESL